MALKDKIKKADDIQSETVEVPEWGVTVDVRTISGARRAEIFAGSTTEDGTVQPGDAYVRLVIAAAYDPETNEPVFDEGDIDWLGKKSSKALERITEVAARLAGLGKEALEQAKQD